MRLTNKIAVVTGAAAGIGSAIAERFADEGATVIALDVNESGLKDVVQRARGKGQNIASKVLDIAQEPSVETCVNEIEAKFGTIDILVNDAATFILKGIDAAREDWQESFDVNVFGTANITKYVSAIMAKKGNGTIVNLASVSGMVAQPLFITYSATKAALIQMTKNLALDLGKSGIRVNCVSPGTIITDASERHAELIGLSLDEFKENAAQDTVINRVGTPADVASAVLFLASDEASFITGTNLTVDGGYTIV